MALRPWRAHSRALVRDVARRESRGAWLRISLYSPHVRTGDRRSGRKTVEGRPGGGWLVRNNTLIKPDDYINFKVCGRKDRALVVSAPVASLSTSDLVLALPLSQVVE